MMLFDREYVGSRRKGNHSFSDRGCEYYRILWGRWRRRREVLDQLTGRGRCTLILLFSFVLVGLLRWSMLGGGRKGRSLLHGRRRRKRRSWVSGMRSRWLLL
jgi:hypothetical protein